jgi:hypothetical protein
MSTTEQEATTTTEKRKVLCGRIAPRFVNALAPMMRQVFDMAHCDFFFMNQVDTRRFGTYLIPAAKGVILAVVDSYRVLAALDPEGDVTEPLKVHFPDAMLAAIKPRMLTLTNQDGEPFEIEMEPKPHSVFVNDICTIVSLDRQADKKHGGLIGSWMNNDDIAHVIDLSSYRAEIADVDFIRKVIKASVENRGPCPALQVNPRLLKPICEAADSLGVMLEFSFAADNGAIAIRSTGEIELFGLIMPTEYSPLQTESSITRALTS